ncbi:AraD1 family protein [Roseibium litorale]|uniref:GguC protein n=1 Tax=Roseibium litorale TaxID=2803841 RepID=A0ABR9CJW0_9HYPH|nr:AraD1 family protein [Roseibium litorale]MBD8891135.1 GguC protein [Roseibium litorale]
MLLSQIQMPDGATAVVAREGTEAYVVKGVASIYDLALDCIRSGQSIAAKVASLGVGEAVDLHRAAEEGRLLLPILPPDPAHLHLTGTGLTHLGSASARNAMHQKLAGDAEELTDSMKMFRLGLEGGKPDGDKPGVQPEWFYKGNGYCAVPSGAPLNAPDFALDGGEEPEIAGIYVIGDDGTPYRIGFALANEFSDHVMEQINYLYLAHSKLRPAAFGPEILLGDLPQNIEGTSKLIRDGQTFWEKPFVSGEANMSYSLANLEHHHFKYDVFRKPGDVHVHMFGTATLSFSDKIRTQDGDVFEISAPAFGLPLRNPLKMTGEGEAAAMTKVTAL